MPPTTELYAEPEKIAVPAQALAKCDGRQNNRFSVDFDALGRVLAHEGDVGQDSVEPRPYSEIRRQDSYRLSATSANLPRSQRIILYSPSFDSTFQATTFQELGIRGIDLPNIFSEDFAGNGERLWWMDIQHPSEKELRLLCSAFRIHPLTVEDILNRETQEKIEDFTNYYFACFRSYRATDTEYKPYTIYMVVFRTGTLSFCFSDSEHADHVLNRIELLKDYLSINSDWIFYAFVDDIVDCFNPSINQIERKVNKIEDQVYTTREDDKQAFIHQIEEVRKSSSSLLRLLGGKQHVLSTFEKHHCGEEHDEEPSDEKTTQGHNLRLYIYDVKDHVTTMLANLNQFESLLARSQSNYLAGLSIDNMRGRQRVNGFINIVAVVSMILTLMNIICALFSTNVNANVPIYANDTPAWYIVLGGEIVLTSALFWLARRLKWC